MYLILMIPMLVAIAMMSFGIWKVRHRGRKSPFNEKLLRGPGHSLDLLRDELTFDSLIYLGAVIFIPFLLHASYLSSATKLHAIWFIAAGLECSPNFRPMIC